MKRHSIWMPVVLMLLILIGLFGFPLIGFAEEGKWTKKADMPTARDNLSTSVVNGKIYVIGGSIDLVGGVAVPTAAIEEYDPATDTWTKKADMPTPRWGLSTSTVDGKIYAIGGKKLGNILSTVEEYDPAMDKWTKKADMPTARGALGTSVVNGKIYAIGGRTEPLGMPPMGHSTVEEYNPMTNRWMKKSDMPTARGHLSTSAVNGKIYAIGGWTIRMAYYSTVEEYDPKTDTWTKKADMPTARNGLATSVVNERIYAVGGLNFQLGGPLSTLEEYNLRFSSLGVEAKGKFMTFWSKIKSNHESLKKHE